MKKTTEQLIQEENAKLQQLKDEAAANYANHIKEQEEQAAERIENLQIVGALRNIKEVAKQKIRINRSQQELYLDQETLESLEQSDINLLENKGFSFIIINHS